MSPKKVAVLLSTYNGDSFLAEQIDSILSQTNVGIDLHIRDDGSKDNTLETLRNYTKFANVHLQSGRNLGPARSFFSLLAGANDYEFYAYADQDDIWLPDKIERATNLLDSLDNSQPLLYLGNARVVDSQGRGSSLLVNTNKKPGLENALVQCFSIGATMVLNKAARSLLTDYAMPLKVTMHDWWTYLVVSALGTVIYDSVPHMLYRQHESNLFGDPGNWKYLKRNWRSILEGQSMIRAIEQAKDCQKIFEEILETPQRRSIVNFSSPDSRSISSITAIRQPIYKKNALGTLVAKVQWLNCSKQI